MTSELGQLIRQRRLELDFGVRELARKIGKSGSFIVRLEKDDPAPSVKEETLRRLARVLELDKDQLITLAGKTPSDVVPEDAEEVRLFRKVKRLSPEERKKFLGDD